MAIHLGRIYKVDGVDTYLYSVDAGSAKEALAEIEAWADELGAAPNPAMAPGTAAPKRSRRTKAEIEADAAAEVAKNTPPALGGAPVQAFAPPQGGPSVALSDKLPVAPQPPGVSVSPPPPPSPSYAPPPQAPISPDQLARADLESAISGLYGSIPHAWVSGAQSIVMGYVNANANGGSIDTMSADQARRTLQLVQNYRKVCDEAPR